MKEFSASTLINATPEAVWAILTDAASYPDWDPGMIRLEGTIGLGEKITAYTKISPDRAFPVTVSSMSPNQSMTWTGGMPLGLFKGERTFTLSRQSDGKTQVDVREQFTGLLLPLFGRTIPDLTQSFEDFVNGLKQRAES